MNTDHIPVPARGTQGLKLLILGGTGFISGALARMAWASGHQTWILTRGQRPAPAGVTRLMADRNNPAAFVKAVGSVGVTWDAVIDCIAFQPEHIAQDLAVFSGRARQLIFISTDSVYDPVRKKIPQPVEPADFASAGYGFQKRRCEVALANDAPADLPWTIVRPSHVYGPGSHLGCLPPAFRDPLLPRKILEGQPIALADGGRFLVQPIFCNDLVTLILSLVHLPGTSRSIFNAPGPQTVTMRAYYEAIAHSLDRELRVVEIPTEPYLREHPEHATSVCDRVYDLAPLEQIRATLPSTPLQDGIDATVRAWEAAHLETMSPPTATLAGFSSSKCVPPLR